MFAPCELLTSQTIPKKPHKKLRSFFGEDERVYIMDAKHTGNIGRFLNVSKYCITKFKNIYTEYLVGIRKDMVFITVVVLVSNISLTLIAT